MDAVRAFAGADPDKAVVEPEARAVLRGIRRRGASLRGGAMNHVDAVARFKPLLYEADRRAPARHGRQRVTLPEARVIYAVGRDGQSTATAIGRELALEPRLTSAGCCRACGAGACCRRSAPRTTAGTSTSRSATRAQGLHADRLALARRDGADARAAQGDRARPLVSAMGAIASLLDGDRQAGEIVLREHRPGDMGWVTERHAVLYYEQDGWGAGFERWSPASSRTSSRASTRSASAAGSRSATASGSAAFSSSTTKGEARLRLLLVEPSVRGAGLGRRLVEECIAFSREKGYKKLVLWTHSQLLAARAIYAARTVQEGCRKTETHDSFGPKAVSEFWELKL